MEINCFYLCNGAELWSLQNLLEALKLMNDDTFHHHVSDDKNDFANWILYELKDKVLAKQISKEKDKAKMISLIDKRINNPSKKKKVILNKIKDAIINE